MSKNVKSSDFSAEAKGYTPVLQLKRSKNIYPSSSKLTITRSDSQQLNQFKTKSSLNLNFKSPILSSISPNRISTRSPVTYHSECRLTSKKKLIKNNSLSKSFYEIQETFSEKPSNLLKEGKILYSKLLEKLNKAKFQDFDEVFKSVQKIFKEIIEKDDFFKDVLGKIKDFYEDIIKELVYGRKNDEIEIQELMNKVKDLKEFNFNLQKNFDLIAKENLEISKELDRSEEICTELQRKLCKIALYELDEYPVDQIRWKSLVMENNSLYESCKKQAEEISSFKYKEKKLFQLIMAIKQRGFPVEDVYQSEIIKKPHLSSPSSLSSNSESEFLQPPRASAHKKPSIIPMLFLPENSYISTPSP